MNVRCLRLCVLFAVVLSCVACSDTAELKELTQSYQITQQPLLDAELTGNGQYLATLTPEDVALRQLSNENVIFLHSTTELPQTPTKLSLSKDLSVLAIASDNVVTLFDITTQTQILQWRARGTVEQAKISELKLNQFGDVILLGMSDGSVSVTNLTQKNQLLYKPHSSDVKHLFFTPFEQQILTASFDGQMILLDLATGKIVQNLEFASRITSLQLDTSSGEIFISDALSNEKVLNLSSFTANTSEPSSLDYVERNRHFRLARFTDNGNKLITTGSKAGLSVWSTENGDELAATQIAAMSMSSTTMDMVVKGNTLITVSSDGIVQNWSLAL